MILVTGAAGKTGLAVIRATAALGGRIRALVRREEQIRKVIDAGASDSVVGDMTSALTFESAAMGIETVYHICPNVSPDEVKIGRTAIQACLQSSVGRFVYHSVLHPQTEEMPHHWTKLKVEEMLLSSGLDFTILQPAAYMQNVLGNWKRIEEEGIFSVPYPVETRISLVDLEDVAEVAAKVMLNQEYSGGIFELAGPEALSQQEIAGILTDVLGYSVTAHQENLTTWKTQMEGRDPGAYQLETLIKMFEYYAKNDFIGNDFVLRQLLQREPRSFRAFALRISEEA